MTQGEGNPEPVTIRSQVVAALFHLYALHQGLVGEDQDCVLSDFLADLFHAARERGWDPEEIADRAFSHHTFEVDEAITGLRPGYPIAVRVGKGTKRSPYRHIFALVERLTPTRLFYRWLTDPPGVERGPVTRDCEGTTWRAIASFPPGCPDEDSAVELEVQSLYPFLVQASLTVTSWGYAASAGDLQALAELLLYATDGKPEALDTCDEQTRANLLYYRFVTRDTLERLDALAPTGCQVVRRHLKQCGRHVTYVAFVCRPGEPAYRLAYDWADMSRLPVAVSLHRCLEVGEATDEQTANVIDSTGEGCKADPHLEEVDTVVVAQDGDLPAVVQAYLNMHVMGAAAHRIKSTSDGGDRLFAILTDWSGIPAFVGTATQIREALALSDDAMATIEALGYGEFYPHSGEEGGEPSRVTRYVRLAVANVETQPAADRGDGLPYACTLLVDGVPCATAVDDGWGGGVFLDPFEDGEDLVDRARAWASVIPVEVVRPGIVMPVILEALVEDLVLATQPKE